MLELARRRWTAPASSGARFATRFARLDHAEWLVVDGLLSVSGKLARHRARSA